MTPEESTGTNRGALARELFPSDIQQMIKAVERGFPMSAGDMAACVTCCRQIMDDPKSARRTKLIAAKALGLFAAHNLKDTHHLERIDQENGIMILKQQRAEQGLPNDSLAVILPPTTQTPMPAWMERMKGECPQ